MIPELTLSSTPSVQRDDFPRKERSRNAKHCSVPYARAMPCISSLEPVASATHLQSLPVDTASEKELPKIPISDDAADSSFRRIQNLQPVNARPGIAASPLLHRHCGPLGGAVDGVQILSTGKDEYTVSPRNTH